MRSSNEFYQRIRCLAWFHATFTSSLRVAAARMLIAIAKKEEIVDRFCEGWSNFWHLNARIVSITNQSKFAKQPARALGLRPRPHVRLLISLVIESHGWADAQSR